MERLTYKNYIEEYELNFEKSSDKNWSISESDTHIKVTGDPIDKLGELEDVLEKYKIENLEEYIKLHQIDNYAQDFINNLLEENKRVNAVINLIKQENNDLKNELSELKQKAIVPKKDKFVIVSNAWKHNKKYGIAKVQQIMTDHYILQTNDNLGSYVPCIQFGEFKTLEEAEHKLAEIKKERKMSKLKIGDKVKFVLGTSLLTGTITKFYKSPYNDDECSVKTEVKTYSHILLHRVSKIEDNQILKKKDKQVADLQHKLEVAERALKKACKQLQDDYCINCDDQKNCSRVEMCEMALSIYLPSDFKEQAEKEVKGE